MSSTLIFAGEDALRLAMTSALVPEALQRGPARVARDRETIAVEPQGRLGRRQLSALKRAGVGVAEQLPAAAVQQVSCWAEIIRPRWVGDETLAAPLVLFALPSGSSLLALAGELLRLGCDRQELAFRSGEPAALLKAIDPPYYSVLRALDHPDGLRAFLASPPGQERLWTEIGFSHPLVDLLQQDDSVGMLMIEREGRFVALEQVTWSSIYQLIDLPLPEMVAHQTAEPPSRLRVELKLLPLAREAPPVLWVLRDDGVAAVDSLVRQLPEAERDRLLFAVAQREADAPLVLLKARGGADGPPSLELPGEAYAPWLEVSNLFLPAQSILEPPLRRETLRQLLAPDPEQIAWLAGGDDGRTFRVEHLAESAFSPLSEWVDYVVHSDAQALEPWTRAVTFDFEPFESIGVEWTDRPAAPRAPEPEAAREPRRRRQRSDREQTAGEEVVSSTIEEQEPEASTVEDIPLPTVALAEASSDEEALLHLQRAYLELDSPADHSERTQLWTQLGRINARLGRTRDAQLCWTRALWQCAENQRAMLAAAWAEDAATLDQQGAARLQRLLDDEVVDLARVQRVVADLVRQDLAGPPPEAELVHRAQVWLDGHDEPLDVRSRWLARLALSRMVGGDQLQLVQTRDRIIAQLHHGLSIARDVPTFVRFAGSGLDEEGGPALLQLTGQLDGLLQRFERVKRKRSPVEAPTELTRGYGLFLFAWSYARLGQTDRARQLRLEAQTSIAAGAPGEDPIHAYLVAAYGDRVEQALEGLPAESPLASEINAQLNALERFARYKVDRLRQASNILEPQERLDPVRAFQQDQTDPRGPEFAPMRAMTDRQDLAAAVEQVLGTALDPQTPAEERARLFDGVMDFFPLLVEAEAVPHLRSLVDAVDDLPAPRRSQLLSEALMLGGLFGRGDLVKELVGRLQHLTVELGGEHVEDLAATVGESLRALRRVGLRQEAVELLTGAAEAATGEGTAALVARLQLAAGLAGLGQLQQAEPTLAQARQVLKDKSLIVTERLQLTRALAQVYSYTPHATALAGLAELAEQLPLITDSFGTNSHFCLAVIQFIEALVLGYASDQLALGEQGRRWLDDDEYLVRRRIHHDLSAGS